VEILAISIFSVIKKLHIALSILIELPVLPIAHAHYLYECLLRYTIYGLIILKVENIPSIMVVIIIEIEGYFRFIRSLSVSGLEKEVFLRRIRVISVFGFDEQIYFILYYYRVVFVFLSVHR
jgi:hypothetical protein